MGTDEGLRGVSESFKMLEFIVSLIPKEGIHIAKLGLVAKQSGKFGKGHDGTYDKPSMFDLADLLDFAEGVWTRRTFDFVERIENEPTT
jgi:hypothetical protein